MARRTMSFNMDSVSYQDLFSIVEELVSETTCPVCLTVLTPPLCCCLRGHSICNKCKKDLVKCPKCRASFAEKNLMPLEISAILNILPRDCRYYSRGCVFFMSPKVLNRHQTSCLYRDVTCFSPECKASSGKIMAKNVFDHVKKEHPLIQRFSAESTVSFKLDSPDIYYTILAKDFDCIFWGFKKKDEKKGKLFLFFIFVPTAENVKDDFYSTITFSKASSAIEYTYTQKIFKEDVNIGNIFSSENCMHVPLSEMVHLLEEDGFIDYRFKIFRGP